MSWLRLDTGATRHPKLLALKPADRWAWLDGLSWCQEKGTDGYFTATEMRAHLGKRVREWSRYAHKMVSVGLWDECPERSRNGQPILRFHDFQDYQPGAERMKAKRKRGTERQARYRQRQREGDAVTGSVTNEPSNAVTPAGRHGVTGVNPVTLSAGNQDGPARAPLEGGPAAPAIKVQAPRPEPLPIPEGEPRPDPPPPRREETAYDDPPLWRDCPACGAKAYRPCLGEVLCPERRPAAHRAPDWQALAAQSPVMAEALRRRKLIGGPEP